LAKAEIVQLTDPIELHGRTVTHVTVAEPTGYQFNTIGEPRILVATGAGGMYFVERIDEIRAYLEKCVTAEVGPDIHIGTTLVKLMSLEDTKKAKAALLSFFEAADVKIAGNKLISASSQSAPSISTQRSA
jgi:hypothetical protein